MSAIPRPFTLMGTTTAGTLYGLGGQTITMPADGSVGINAGGTNQNIILTPSGTGFTRLSNATSKFVFAEYASDGYARLALLATATTATAANSLLSYNGGANVYWNVPSAGGQHQFQINGSQQVAFVGSHTLLGGLTTDGTGQLQLNSSASLGALPSGATTAGGSITVPAATYTVTGTNTATAFQGLYFGAPTFTNAGVGTITDAFNTIFAGPAVAAGSQVITRSHTLGIVDSTSASSSITGGLVVATTLGTSATSVGIGGGNIYAGSNSATSTATPNVISLGGQYFNGNIPTSSAALKLKIYEDTPGAANAHGITASVQGMSYWCGTAADHIWLTESGTERMRLSNRSAYGALPSGTPFITGTALTIAAQTSTVTGTSTTTYAQGNYFGVPTITDASAGTITDFFNANFIGPAAGAGSLTVTRAHTVGILDSTSASSSITGGLVVATTYGTTATSVGIGGGNINAGGTLTVGGASTLTGAVTQTAKTTTYNNIATQGNGVPAIVKKTRITGQTTNATIATYTAPAADGSYEVSANMNVTAATTLVTTITCAYTDESNTARTMVMPVNSLNGTFVALGAISGAGATVWHTPVMHIRVKASTAITLATTAGTFTGVTYTAEGIIKQTD